MGFQAFSDQVTMLVFIFHNNSVMVSFVDCSNSMTQAGVNKCREKKENSLSRIQFEKNFSNIASRNIKTF